MLKAWLIAAVLSAAPFAPALASSDSGLSYGCSKVGGRYVMVHGSKCFPHPSAETQVRRERGVVVGR